MLGLINLAVATADTLAKTIASAVLGITAISASTALVIRSGQSPNVQAAEAHDRIAQAIDAKAKSDEAKAKAKARTKRDLEHRLAALED